MTTNNKIITEDAPVTKSAILVVWAFIAANPLLVPAITLFILLVARPLYRRYSSPLRQFPGPFLASCTRAWRMWSVWTGKNEQHYIDVHRKYGPIVRTGPNEVSLSSPEAALDLFKTGKGFHKTDFYGVFPPPENPDIFTETREPVHGVKKRYAATPYSLASMQQCTDRIEGTEQLLISQLDKFTEDHKVCDLGDWLHFFAFDVLGEVAFSKKFGFLEAGVDVDRAIKTIDDSQWYNGLIGQVPWLDHIFRRNPLWQFIPFLATKNALVTRVAMGQLEKRTNPQGEKVEYKDLLNSLIEAQKQHPEALGKGDVFAIAHGAIFAGSDSTASTMQSFMWQVVSNKRVYEKLMKEILAADLSDMVTYNEAQNLPYFQACLKEAMRINPAVGLNITRKVPLGGAELGCHKLPGGTEVAVNGWVLHRDTSIFGEDAEVFRPERWIEGDKENIKRMERCMFQVRFLSSPRSCSRAQLLRRYEIQLVNPKKGLEHHSSFFVVQWGLLTYLTLREKA